MITWSPTKIQTLSLAMAIHNYIPITCSRDLNILPSTDEELKAIDSATIIRQLRMEHLASTTDEIDWQRYDDYP